MAEGQFIERQGALTHDIVKKGLLIRYEQFFWKTLINNHFFQFYFD
jgi:hypothetical protein